MPLSTIEPMIVVPAILIAVFAVIVPALLTLPPVKHDTALTSMPMPAAEIEPELVMPPWKVETVLARMPVDGGQDRRAAGIDDPPENDETLVTAMPVTGSIVPALVMPPLKPLRPET